MALLSLLDIALFQSDFAVSWIVWVAKRASPVGETL